MKRKTEPIPEPTNRVVAVRLVNQQNRHGEKSKVSRGKQCKPRVRGVNRLRNPMVCIATNRFTNRYHIRSSGVHPERSQQQLRTVSGSDRELQAPGTKINPTKITACESADGGHGGLATRRDVDIDLQAALKHPDWCPECKALLESWMLRQKLREELNS